MTRDKGSGESGQGWPKLLRFLAINAAIGAALGAVFAVVLIVTNTGGIGDLILRTSDPVSPVLLFVVGFATLIGGLYTASAVMLVPWKKKSET